MKFFPEEIEADLLAAGLDIHDWWNRVRGESGALRLSSRRLLSFVSQLPESSRFKSVARDDWDEDRYIQVGILNELRIMRADNVAMHASNKMEPILVKSPAQQKAEEEKEESNLALRGGIMAQLRGGLAVASTLEVDADEL